jgi:hypothetical protein
MGDEKRNTADHDPSLWVAVICFVLPVLYEVFILVPFDQGAKTERDFRLILQAGFVGILLISLLAPACVIALSTEKWTAKIGHFLLVLFAWVVVQFCAGLLIGLWSFSQSGFEGVFQ